MSKKYTKRQKDKKQNTKYKKAEGVRALSFFHVGKLCA